jgi:hypothetical protein
MHYVFVCYTLSSPGFRNSFVRSMFHTLWIAIGCRPSFISNRLALLTRGRQIGVSIGCFVPSDNQRGIRL